jgi:hypothetical protein
MNRWKRSTMSCATIRPAAGGAGTVRPCAIGRITIRTGPKRCDVLVSLLAAQPSALTSASASSSQNRMSISRYIVVAA